MYVDRQALEHRGVLLELMQRQVRMVAIGHGEAKRFRAPQGGSEQIHSMHDLLVDALQIIDARTKVDGDVQGAGLGPQNASPGLLQRVVWAY